jgi:nucleotide-binding universal stress UspA family protein
MILSGVEAISGRPGRSVAAYDARTIGTMNTELGKDLSARGNPRVKSTASRPAVEAVRTTQPPRVLVPIIRGQVAAPILSVADAIARSGSERGLVLGLVETSASDKPQVGATERSRDLLRWIAATGHGTAAVDGSRLKIQTRITSDAGRSIREATLETQSNMVVLEWPAATSPRRHRLEAIIRSLATDPPARLVIARLDPGQTGRFAPRSVLAPLRGGANARIALSVAVALAKEARATLTLLHVYDSHHHPARQEREAAAFRDLVQEVRSINPVVLELVAPDPVVVLLGECIKYDAVVLGAHSNETRPGIVVGPTLESFVQSLPKTVVLTRSLTPTYVY